LALSRQFDFNGSNLAEAIRRTFEKRKTNLTNEIVAFSDSFINEKKTQWSTFHRRLKQTHVPESFSDIVADIKKFLGPIIQALIANANIPSTWIAPLHRLRGRANNLE
jgi:hypothetical protein